MTSKFKVGDRVRSLRNFSGTYGPSVNPLIAGAEHTIISVHEDFGTIKIDLDYYNNGRSTAWDETWFELVETETELEKALRLVQEAGYDINPPKPLRSGKAVVIEYSNGEIGATLLDVYLTYFKSDPDITLLDVIDWEEKKDISI